MGKSDEAPQPYELYRVVLLSQPIDNAPSVNNNNSNINNVNEINEEDDEENDDEDADVFHADPALVNDNNNNNNNEEEEEEEEETTATDIRNERLPTMETSSMSTTPVPSSDHEESEADAPTVSELNDASIQALTSYIDMLNTMEEEAAEAAADSAYTATDALTEEATTPSTNQSQAITSEQLTITENNKNLDSISQLLVSWILARSKYQISLKGQT